MYNMVEIIGWLGSILLTFCSLPQLIKSLKTRKVNDFSGLFLSLWFFGELLMLIYIVCGSIPISIPLLINYLFNTIIVLILIRIKY